VERRSVGLPLARSAGHGLGAALYEALFALLRMQGYCTVYAIVTQPNERSMALHRRFGFEQVGLLRKSGFKFGLWRDISLLEKQIAPRADAPRPPRAFGSLPAEQVRAALEQGERCLLSEQKEPIPG
jgi:phosphinothricin acetyltransferase